MKKRILIICSILVVLCLIYLNRSYAHIYNYTADIDLVAPNTESKYLLGTSPSPSNVYVAIGDSLTAGVGVDTYQESYPYQLAENISQEGEKVELNIVAVPGAKSKDILILIDSIIKLQPDVITLLIGVNDIHGNISQDEFRQNYEQILIQLTQQTKAKIYLISIPYIGAEKLIRQPYAFYFDYQTREFNKVIKKLSDTFSLTYVDLYSKTSELSHQENYYSADLFHPAALGYTNWSQILYDYFNQ